MGQTEVDVVVERMRGVDSVLKTNQEKGTTYGSPTILYILHVLEHFQVSCWDIYIKLLLVMTKKILSCNLKDI